MFESNQNSHHSGRVRQRFTTSGAPSYRAERVEPRQSSDHPRRPFNPNGNNQQERYRRPYNPNGDYQQISQKPMEQKKKRKATRNFSDRKKLEYTQRYEDPTVPIRLNKYLANAGICSRREADDFIRAGVITVNGDVVDSLGAKVLITDDVRFHDQPVRREQKIYVLLNKPKNTVTTTDDPEERNTVLDLVRTACPERIYPVGRLDRNTTGVLLLTNDGDLAAKLTHPRYGKKKVYSATLNRELDPIDEAILRNGVVLDDERITPDALEFPKNDRINIGLEIHSGQNRVVRRMFEKIGYRVMRLDRVSFAGLTKKGLARGKFRFLTQKEVNYLQMGSFE